MIVLLILAAMLDSNNFRLREAATKTMPVCSWTVPLLEGIEKHGSPESARRCTYLLNIWYANNAEKFSHRLGKLPWLCALHCDSYRYYLQQTETSITRNMPDVVFCGSDRDWPRWREATRLWVVARITCRQPYEPMLKLLWEEEARWRKDNPKQLRGG